MRIGFTIALNALHHLQHNEYASRMRDALDHWVIVEGLALPSGSTSWCKNVPAEWHKEGHSVDGTIEYVHELERKWHNIVLLQSRHGTWDSKDAMVNAALERLAQLDTYDANTFLWQIDADEQWTRGQMAAAENGLIRANGDTGMFLAQHYVGPGLVARGEWGEGRKLPYRRLWRWQGQSFATHEPPKLTGGNGVEVLLPQRFEHYAYYFEQDVRFKEAYYSGHENLYQRWKLLQDRTDFPCPVSELVSGAWGKTDTVIARI